MNRSRLLLELLDARFLTLFEPGLAVCLDEEWRWPISEFSAASFELKYRAVPIALGCPEGFRASASGDPSNQLEESLPLWLLCSWFALGDFEGVIAKEGISPSEGVMAESEVERAVCKAGRIEKKVSVMRMPGIVM